MHHIRENSKPVSKTTSNISNLLQNISTNVCSFHVLCPCSRYVPKSPLFPFLTSMSGLLLPQQTLSKKFVLCHLFCSRTVIISGPAQSTECRYPSCNHATSTSVFICSSCKNSLEMLGFMRNVQGFIQRGGGGGGGGTQGFPFPAKVPPPPPEF